MKKFKGYDVVKGYPEDGWLKGYFYAKEEDLKGAADDLSGSYQDLGFIKHKDCILNLLDIGRGEKVLDVGCAHGAMMVYCGLLGAEIYGIDISPDLIKMANQYLNKFKIKGEAILSDAKKTTFPENFFDKVVSADFFEHLNSEENVVVLNEIKRVLKPGGIIVIKTPNLTYLRCAKFYKQMKRALTFKNPLDVIIPHTVGSNRQHVGLTTRSRMVNIIKAAGFSNFSFYYGINSKIERCNYMLGEVLSESLFLRDFVTEEIIVKIYKPIIASLFI
jgi:2-polyprenyl-3-methyl-5-hydroxy-6-metoxy-1,4-benzoquinol methylase